VANDNSSSLNDVRNLLKNIAQPMMSQLDGKVRDYIDEHVNSTVEMAVGNRLTEIEKSLAEIQLVLEGLRARIDAL
jgi:hypothetical protein